MVSRINIVMLTAGHVGGLFFFNSKKEHADVKKEMKNTENADPSMLCKFVLDGSGKKIGESISIDHDVLIIKAGSRFLGVPLKHVESGEKTLLVKGLLDFTKAYELGEKWQKQSYRGMDDHGPAQKQ